jgi:hypothetical protein
LAWGWGGLDLTGSGHGPVAGCCECGDEPLGSCTTDLVKIYVCLREKIFYNAPIIIIIIIISGSTVLVRTLAACNRAFVILFGYSTGLLTTSD